MRFLGAQGFQPFLIDWQAPGDAERRFDLGDYVLGRMTDTEGGFYSAEDADSEGEEGKYYVWTPAEIEDVLGAGRAGTFAAVYDVKPGGNWEGRTILNRPRPVEDVASTSPRESVT